jgi:putative tryptophan/tyrosine transport system substrate-binding protein
MSGIEIPHCSDPLTDPRQLGILQTLVLLAGDEMVFDQLRRREFLGVLGGAAAAWPVVGRAQQSGSVRRIGVLMGLAASDRVDVLAPFRQRLEALGWQNGRNAQIEVRWWQDDPQKMQALAAELLAISPDVMMVATNAALAVVARMTAKVPIVFTGVGDPVGSGFVPSFARPGGNITGFASYEPSMGVKWLEVLKETVPSLTRVLVILHPETPVNQAFWRSIQTGAPVLGVEATAAGVHDAIELEHAISAFAANGGGALVVLPGAVTNTAQSLIIALQLRYRLPTIAASTNYVSDGGLVSYRFDLGDSFRGAAEYVDRILRGAKAADLPVQAPIRFKLFINLKTAKALGIEVPPMMLGRADEVIE